VIRIIGAVDCEYGEGAQRTPLGGLDLLGWNRFRGVEGERERGERTHHSCRSAPFVQKIALGPRELLLRDYGPMEKDNT
jgi:hypothetical protein